MPPAASLGQAGRIPGVSPSDLHSLVMEVSEAKSLGNVSRETSGPAFNRRMFHVKPSGPLAYVVFHPILV